MSDQLLEDACTQLQTIQAEIREWADRNFGNNSSKTDPVVVLGSVGPLLGIIEELGELAAAKTKDEEEDAIADTGVFLCDYAGRERVDLAKIYRETALQNSIEMVDDTYRELVLLAGQAAHCTLKRHQGIRGFMEDPKYVGARDRVVAWLVRFLCRRAGGYRFNALLQKTWDKVKLRDWQKNPANAHAVAEAPS